MSERPPPREDETEAAQQETEGASGTLNRNSGSTVLEDLATESTQNSLAESGVGDENDGELTAEDLVAQVELLRFENHRLRREYARAHESTYRRTAIGLFVIGAVSLGGAYAFPAVRTVLLALGVTGVFASFLVYYLTPEQFVAAEVGERSYSALSDTLSDLLEQLGMSDVRVYVPTTDADIGSNVRLFVPQRDSYRIPDDEALSLPLVLTDDKQEWGFSARPVGAALFEEFEKDLAEPLAESPVELSSQLAEVLTDSFELVDMVETEYDRDGGRLTFLVFGSVWGGFERFDHPVTSFLGVGVATGVGRTVETDVSLTPDRDADAMVTLTWDAG